MTDDELIHLHAFEAMTQRVLQALQQAKEERKQLHQQLTEIQEENARLHEQIAALQHNCSDLRLGKLIAGGGDVKDAQKRISALVRQINKCITLLSNGPLEVGNKELTEEPNNKPAGEPFADLFPDNE